MLKGFRQFMLRGNMIDLAVGVVIGAAFGNVIAAFVRDLLTPLIAAVGGQPDFSRLSFTINNSRFLYGDFLNVLLSFLIIGAVVYFLVLLPLSRLRERPSEADLSTTRKCPECLSDIPLEARRCAHCASAVVPAPLPKSRTAV